MKSQWRIAVNVHGATLRFNPKAIRGASHLATFSTALQSAQPRSFQTGMLMKAPQLSDTVIITPSVSCLRPPLNPRRAAGKGAEGGTERSQ